MEHLPKLRKRRKGLLRQTLPVHTDRPTHATPIEPDMRVGPVSRASRCRLVDAVRAAHGSAAAGIRSTSYRCGHSMAGKVEMWLHGSWDDLHFARIRTVRGPDAVCLCCGAKKATKKLSPEGRRRLERLRIARAHRITSDWI